MKSVIAILLFVILIIPLAESFDYQVGDQNGWAIPPNEDWSYNHWASQHRFKINDTLRFQYKDDSVMLVKDGDYNKCETGSPIFFSNSGNTLFKLNESRSFYFMSGVSGHCQRGQKMIVRVLEERTSDSTHPPPPSNGGAANVGFAFGLSVLSFIIAVSLF
ncbi:mavicyanin-like [Impatiens glandulifera]|uniref:mavicyanin-like n=1 Tax=Impatiens glandulifera TaxID=253017 RepID=UPI001FB0C00A|nr:mavicyanin-like [Impatiens glandulifera]